jgi:hypothetical protein
MNHYSFNARSKSFTNAQEADLFRRLAIAFSMHPRDGWRDVHVIVRQGLVTLIGEVPTFHSRQLLVAVARHVAGVLRVTDELKVVDLPTSRAQSSTELSATSTGPAQKSSNVVITPNLFAHVPTTTESLEDIVAAS